ncbi:TonB-dependent receptor [Sphingomonas sp. DT-204]|uniref:TonB-dependent receptor n=1 Tax=Sphingomonas sp. DT-204 TaxID=3396166 RepID=UPI003F1D55BB
MGKLNAIHSVSALALTVALSTPAHAQDTGETQPAAPGEQGSEDIVVTGIRQSMRDALDVKRSSDKVVDAISAKEIGVLPDVTIAESINRLPGVNATRDRGNDSQAVIRGLGARLVLGTINGREVASSEPDRNVRWEIYPSEVVSGVEVYKSQSADLIAGGVAATVNISTLDPLDYRGPALVVRAGPVFYDGGKDFPGYDRLGYRASGSFVHKLTDDLAIVLGVTAQKQRNGYPSFQGWGYNDSEARPPAGASDFTGDLDGDGTPDPTPWGAQVSNTRIDQDRFGVSTGLSWQPTDGFKLKADFLYSDISIEERQDQTVYGQNNWGNWDNGNAGDYNAPGASYTLIDGDVIRATLPFSSVGTALARYVEKKKLYIGGLNGRWSSDDWAVTADLSYSRAERRNAWMAVRTEVYPASMSFDFSADRVPSITTTEDPSTLPQVAQNYRSGSYDGPENLKDELGAVALDFSRELDGFVKRFNFGLRGSHRVKRHDSAMFVPSVCGPVEQAWMCSTGSVTIPADMFTPYNVSAFNVPTLLTGDVDAIAALAYGADPFDPDNAVDEPAEAWRVKERVFESYAKLDFGGDLASGGFSGNLGVRIVHVETTSRGNQQDAISGTFTPVSVEDDYTRVLPSANVRFDFGGGKVLRLGAAKVIARPPLDELRASRTLTQWQPYTGSGGNPNLKPFEAWQFDASFEYYFRPESLFAVAGYYKLVDSYIGWKQTPMTFSGLTYSVSTPVNGSSGYIRGVEVTFQTPFFFLGLDSVGIYSNYAFADSDLEEYAPANDPLKIVGLARHTATVDLWYAKSGLQLRGGMKYHSPFTVIYGWNGADLQTLEEETTFDASASYDISDNITVRAQVNNLTNERLRMYRDNKPDRIGRYDLYGRRYLFDVTLKF